VNLLSARLIDAVDLQLHSKQAHWNVKRPTLLALHELLEKLCLDMEYYVNRLAERIVQLGGYADAGARTVARQSTLAEYPRVEGACQHVAALAAALAVVATAIRRAVAEADKVGDADTAALFREIARGVDKWVWFVDGHLNTN
jgi:starvation-inducible DNA-binding protein